MPPREIPAFPLRTGEVIEAPNEKPIAGKAGIGPHLSIFNLPSKPI